MSVPDSGGVVRNVCLESDCWALDGAAHTLSAAFITYVSGHGSGGWYSGLFNRSPDLLGPQQQAHRRSPTQL